MPTPSCDSIQEFANEYDKYCSYTRYASQWLSSIARTGLCLQGNANYDTALSAEERAALEANVVAAQAAGIVPVVVPSGIPNPPKP